MAGKDLEIWMWKAARSFIDLDFDHFMNMIQVQDQGAYKWLMDCKHDRWSRCTFGTNAKCNYITNNFSESFNNFIGSIR